MKTKRLKHERERIYQENKEEHGFSLLEMVVAMGILIVLTVGGVLAYNGITQNSKEAATLAAAKSVHTAALAYDVDNDSSTSYTDAADEYNDSQDSDESKSSLVTQVNKLDDGSLCSVATYGDDEIVEVIGSGSADDCVSENEWKDYEGPIFVSRWNPDFSGKSCAGGEGKLVELPVNGNVDISIDWGDGTAVQSEKDRVSSLGSMISHCYEDKRDKTIVIYGIFERIGGNSETGNKNWTPEAIISVDKWQDTETIVAFMAFSKANNLESLVEPPATIFNMNNMFKDNTSFNKDISHWDVSNVSSWTSFNSNAALEDKHVPNFNR